MNEKRKQARFTINQMIEISVSKEKHIISQGLNISEGGIFFKTDQELDPTARLFIMITLSGDDEEKTFHCEGSVVRCEKKGKEYVAAMQFGDICMDDKGWIKKHLKELNS
jgi:hypothetical protein